MPGQTRADAGTGAGDDGDASAEDVAVRSGADQCRVRTAGRGRRSALYSANGTESSASSTTVIDVNTRPFSPRRIPTSTTPLDTSNGTLLVIWLT